MSVGRCLGGTIEVLDGGVWCSFFAVNGDVACTGFGGVGWGYYGGMLKAAM